MKNAEKAAAAAGRAFATAATADAACRAAENAATLLETDPSAWALADAAYWLCRAAEKAAEDAADSLDPDLVDDYPYLFSAHTAALSASEQARGWADHLVGLANAAGREIRR